MGNDNQRSFPACTRDYAKKSTSNEYHNVNACNTVAVDADNRKACIDRDNLMCGLSHIKAQRSIEQVSGTQGGYNRRGTDLRNIPARLPCSLLNAEEPLEPCPTCGRKFSKEAAVRHFPICARIKEKANKRIQKRSFLKNKVKTEMIERNISPTSSSTVTLIPCTNCGKNINSHDMSKHIKICTSSRSVDTRKSEDKNKLCDIIKRVSRSESNKKHRSMIPRPCTAKESKSPIICPCCNKKFSTKYASRHIPLCLKNKEEQEQSAKLKSESYLKKTASKSPFTPRDLEKAELPDSKLNFKYKKLQELTASSNEGSEDFFNHELPSEITSMCHNCSQAIPLTMEKDHSLKCDKLKAAEIALKNKHSCAKINTYRKNRKNKEIIHDSLEYTPTHEHPENRRNLSGEMLSMQNMIPTIGAYCKYCEKYFKKEVALTHVALCERLSRVEDSLRQQNELRAEVEGGSRGDVKKDVKVQAEPAGYLLIRHDNKQETSNTLLASLSCPCCKSILDLHTNPS